MKKLLIALLFFTFILGAEAQVFTGGIKAGLNYSSNGDLEDDLSTIKISSDGDVGFHVGLFAEMKLPLFLYVRPEFVFTHTSSNYDFVNGRSNLSIDKIDAPILVGFRVLKIGRLFLGPAFQYIINSDLSNSDAFDEIKQVSSSDFSMGAQFGFGIELGKLGVDVRWERGLSDSEINYIGMIDDEISNFTIDARPEQFILSLYYKFR